MRHPALFILLFATLSAHVIAADAKPAQRSVVTDKREHFDYDPAPRIRSLQPKKRDDGASRASFTGSINEADGKGSAFKPFVNASGQVLIDPDVWRRAERNRTGDRLTFAVRLSVLDEISFQAEVGERFVMRLAQILPNREHTPEVIPTQPGGATIERLDVFEPPMKQP